MADLQGSLIYGGWSGKYLVSEIIWRMQDELGQAQLDRVKELGLKPDFHNVLSAESGWNRQMMFQTARSEMDNTALLMEMLKTNTDPLLDLAPSRNEEDIRRLGPDIVEQLQKKLNIMNAHWQDYKRIFNTPNL